MNLEPNTLQRPRFTGLLSWIRSLQWLSVILGIATPLVLAGGYSLMNGDTTAQKITGEIVTVGQRDITLSTTALGTVELANEQQLRFNVQGRVAKVYVKTGDVAKRDDLLAELDKTDPNNDIRQVQLQVNDAYLSLQDTKASRDETVITAQNSVRDLERQLEDAYGDLPSAQMDVENAIEQAKRTILEKEAAYKKAQHDLAVSIEDAIVDADGLLDDILKILSGESVIRGATRYKTFEIDFPFTDYDLKNKTEFAFYDASKAHDDLRGKHGALPNVEDTRELELALEDAIVVAQKIVDLADVSYKFLLTAAPSSTYTDADINALRTTMNTKRTTVLTLFDTLRDQKATLTKPGTSTAYQDLEDAREALELLESQKKNGTTAADTAQRTIDNLNDKLRAQKESMNNTISGVDVQISQQGNTVAQRQLSLEKARKALENYELRAPFDGIIRRVDFQVGDNLLADAGETKYIVLENPDYFIVTVQLDQVDVVNVKEGQKATITFDAIPNKVFDGEVNLIDTTPIQTSGVVSYEVQIILPPAEGYTILSGMTATVEIQTAAAENVIAVPNLALSTQGNRTFVTAEDGTRIPVEIGMSDGEYTEVLSGLSVGDRIQSINVSLNASQSTGQQGGAPGGGGLGGRGGLTPFGGGGRPR